jgi:hypothetical protein
MKKPAYVIVSFIIAVSLSCKKNNTGGQANVVAFPQHHSKPIYGATAYVKFGAKDLPPDPVNNFDLKVVGQGNEEQIHINGLRYGYYYLYAVGYDSSIKLPVTGGIAVHIKWSDRKKELDIQVPVTE